MVELVKKDVGKGQSLKLAASCAEKRNLIWRKN